MAALAEGAQIADEGASSAPVVDKAASFIGDEEDEDEDASMNLKDDDDDDDDDDEDEDEDDKKQAEKDKQDNPFEYLAEPPNSMKELVACRACGLVKTFTQFYDNDCDNCDIMGQDRARIRLTTTKNFVGLCGIFQPEQSWAARWQGFNSLKPGLYTLKLLEELPEDIKAELDQSKTPYLKEDVTTRQDDEMLGAGE
jgi:transcription elongation factor SPT4